MKQTASRNISSEMHLLPLGGGRHCGGWGSSPKLWSAFKEYPVHNWLPTSMLYR